MLRASVPALVALFLLGVAAPAGASSPMNAVDGWVAVEDSFVRSLSRANIASGGNAAMMLDEADALRCRKRTAVLVRCSWAWRDGDAVGISAYGEVWRRKGATSSAVAGTQSYRFRVEIREVDPATDACVSVTRLTLTKRVQRRPSTASGLGGLDWSTSTARARNPLAFLPICPNHP